MYANALKTPKSNKSPVRGRYKNDTAWPNEARTIKMTGITITKMYCLINGVEVPLTASWRLIITTRSNEDKSVHQNSDTFKTHEDTISYDNTIIYCHEREPLVVKNKHTVRQQEHD